MWERTAAEDADGTVSSIANGSFVVVNTGMGIARILRRVPQRIFFVQRRRWAVRDVSKRYVEDSFFDMGGSGVHFLHLHVRKLLFEESPRLLKVGWFQHVIFVFAFVSKSQNSNGMRKLASLESPG